MLEADGGDDSASGGALDEAVAEEEGFDFVFQGVDGDVDAVADGLNSCRATGEDFDQGLEVLAVGLF